MDEGADKDPRLTIIHAPYSGPKLKPRLWWRLKKYIRGLLSKTEEVKVTKTEYVFDVDPRTITKATLNIALPKMGPWDTIPPEDVISYGHKIGEKVHVFYPDKKEGE